MFEPADFGGRTATSCTGAYSTDLDEDGDGYTNADEIDNGTDPCSAADEPHDWNRNFVSDRNDPNDDSDAVADVSDPFAIDAGNGLNTHIPISYSWKNGASVNPCAPTPYRSGCPGGLLGLGFTGLMTDGHTELRPPVRHEQHDRRWRGRRADRVEGPARRCNRARPTRSSTPSSSV